LSSDPGPDDAPSRPHKFTPKKASGTTGKTLELPLLKVLDDVINASATGAETPRDEPRH
jgi:hypothetical protein